MLVGEGSSGLLRWTLLKSVLYRLVDGEPFFGYNAVDCTEEFFNKLMGEEFSGVLWWTILRTVLYRLVGEHFFNLYLHCMIHYNIIILHA